MCGFDPTAVKERNGVPRDRWNEREVRVLMCNWGEMLKVSDMEITSHGDMKKWQLRRWVMSLWAFWRRGSPGLRYSIKKSPILSCFECFERILVCKEFTSSINFGWDISLIQQLYFYYLIGLKIMNIMSNFIIINLFYGNMIK